MNFSSLNELPEGVAEALDRVDAFDEALLLGLARLGPAQKDALKALGATFAGTPLGPAVAEAVAATSSGQALAAHALTLAAARAALDGAAHDALLARAAAAMSMGAPPPAPPPAPPVASPQAALLEALRQWLLELALSGLANVDAAAILPFLATAERLREHPELGRLTLLLTGFIDELLGSLPLAALPALPRRRWADLWTRCMLGTLGAPPDPGEAVSGELRVAGVELLHHDHAISAVLHGWLESPSGGRWVRCTLSAWKTDAISGDEALALLAREHRPAFAALAEDRALRLTGARLLASGDLLPGEVQPGDTIDPFEVATRAAPAPLAPADRHPALLALPVLLDGVRLSEDTVELDGQALPLATARVGPLSGLDPSKLGRVRRAFGLLRFDGRAWAFQPLLCAEGGAKARRLGPDLPSAIKAKTPTYDTLHAKARLLLREKS